MPFETDTTWPPGLLTIFDHGRARSTTLENRYYGPYNKLLDYCFGNTFAYYVAPQKLPTDDNRETVDFIVFLVVFDNNGKPVFLLDVKNDNWAQNPELRFRADKQMRERYALMLHDCPVPRLWGLSVLGTSMRVYCGDTQTLNVDPPSIPRPEPSGRVLSHSFLADGWSVDIMSQDGFTKMKEIVTDILTHSNNVQ
ncbi:hypothetical protein M422DRAFT_237347 [Sphaerobolus stellatus SS14]|uniref:Fungal-type protein kinase domain-containing protein n=1 Tax=Sphaerobolus stellatus (strain SS14) TaxID=990650 RepID=A0A0C9UHN6_SPHS4|nr:hypothetical protein M422DRAFT_237347 [Sphaerobolus stellatus SS14]